MDQKAARDHETDSGQNKVRFGRLRAAGRRVLPLLAAAGFAFLGVYLYGILFPAPLPPSQAEIDASVNQILASVTPQPAYSTTVYQNILPSLVFIRVTGEDANEDEGYSIGSGVVVTDQGDILTAYHVVDNSFKIEVFFADGSQAAAELIAAEPENDIAMLRP
ncbi:MAG TPA: S1C family serine protease, partial [Anaerolineales bacterium]|nr:S1C family serine protease [Anaerolineales bacterium]